MADQVARCRPPAMNIPHVLDFVTGKTVTEYGVNEAAGVDEFVARMDQHGARRPRVSSCGLHEGHVGPHQSGDRDVSVMRAERPAAEAPRRETEIRQPPGKDPEGKAGAKAGQKSRSDEGKAFPVPSRSAEQPRADVMGQEEATQAETDTEKRRLPRVGLKFVEPGDGIDHVRLPGLVTDTHQFTETLPVPGQGHARDDKPLRGEPRRQRIHGHRRKVEAVHENDTTAHGARGFGPGAKQPAGEPTGDRRYVICHAGQAR